MKNKLWLVGLLSFFMAEAQNDKLDVQEVQVVEQFVPEVLDAQKLNIIPQIEDTFSVERSVHYTILPKEYVSQFRLDTIKAAKIKGEPINKLYASRVQLGLGNAALPSLSYQYNSLRDKKWAYGLHAAYEENYLRSSDRYADQRFTHFSAFGKGVFDQLIIKANASREGHVLHAYGYQIPQLSTALTKEQTKQYWGYSKFQLSAESKHNNLNRLRYWTQLHLSDLNEFTENNYRFTANLGQRFGSVDYSLGFKADYYTNNTAKDVVFAADTVKEGVYTLSPRFETTYEGVRLMLGFDEVINNRMTDTVGLGFYFIPQLQAKYTVSPELFEVYAGLRSSLQKNTYWSLSQENPFVNNALSDGGLELRNTSVFDFYAGLSTYLHSTMHWTAECSYAMKEDMRFFMLDRNTLYHNKFMAIYDDVKHLQLKSDLKWIPSANKWLNLSLAYHLYQMTDLSVPSGMPNLEAAVDGYYNIGDKIVTSVGVHTAFNRTALVSFNPLLLMTEVDLENVIDVRFSVEYKYNKVISAYLSGERLIGGYDLWSSYPVISPQLKLGFSYQF